MHWVQLDRDVVATLEGIAGGKLDMAVLVDEAILEWTKVKKTPLKRRLRRFLKEEHVA